MLILPNYAVNITYIIVPFTVGDEFLEKGIAGLENNVKNPQTREKELERQLSDAHKKIGQLMMDIEILKKKTNWGRK